MNCRKKPMEGKWRKETIWNDKMGWYPSSCNSKRNNSWRKWMEGKWKKKSIPEIMRWVACYPSSCSSKRNNNWRIMNEGIMKWVGCFASSYSSKINDNWRKWIEGQWRKELIWEIMNWDSCYPSSYSSKRNNNWSEEGNPMCCEKSHKMNISILKICPIWTRWW